MASSDLIPADFPAPPRPTPIWAPGVGYLLTTGVISALFMIGPAIVAILLGVKVDAPIAMRGAAIAAGVVLVIAYVLAMAAVFSRRRIYRCGPLARAAITSRTEFRNRAGKVGARYEVQFSVEGREARRKIDLDNLAFRTIGFEPQVGDVAFVAYDATRPRRCFFWAFERGDGRRFIPGQR